MRETGKKILKMFFLAVVIALCVPQAVMAGETVDITDTGAEFYDLTRYASQAVTYTAGEGTVTWTPASEGNPAKLTLNNATIDNQSSGHLEAIYIETDKDVVLEIIGTNKITSYDYSIYIQTWDSAEELETEGYCNINVRGSGTLSLNCRMGVFFGGNTVISGGVTISSFGEDVKGVLEAISLSIENARIVLDEIYVYGDMEVKTGVVNVYGVVIGDVSSTGYIIGNLNVSPGATVNVAMLTVTGQINNAGSLNAIGNVYSPEGEMSLTVYGNYELDDYVCNSLNSLSGEPWELVLASEAKLTIPSDLGLNLSSVTLDMTEGSSIVANGALLLPEGYTAADIADLNITGYGMVALVQEDGYAYYETDGTEINISVMSLDFNNVGDEEGQTPATGDGYAWDESTKTLTLSGLVISGSINLPRNTTVELKGVNRLLDGELTIGEGVATEADFTLAGDGVLMTASSTFEIHVYGEPEFVWTKTSGGYTAVAVFTCSSGEVVQKVDAVVTSKKETASCKADGKITYTAKAVFDGKEYTGTKEVTLPALAHTWNGGVLTKDATEKTKGEMTYTCSVCKQTKKELIDIPKKGMLIRGTRAIYKVTKSGSLSGKKGSVTYMKPAKKNTKIVAVPATIKANGITYKVTAIAAKAFKNNKKITKVTIGTNVGVIGASAFYKCSKLKTIVINTKKLTLDKVGKKAFKGINAGASIKVPKKKYNAYISILRKRGVGKKVVFKK